jgi:hypothetical protein
MAFSVANRNPRGFQAAAGICGKPDNFLKEEMTNL